MSESLQTPSQTLFVPLLLVFASLVPWFGFQTVQLIDARTNLTRLRASQDPLLQTAEKMRAQLDAIASGTARLAEAGNPQAAQVIQALRARNITINPDAAQKQP